MTSAERNPVIVRVEPARFGYAGPTPRPGVAVVAARRDGRLTLVPERPSRVESLRIMQWLEVDLTEHRTVHTEGIVSSQTRYPVRLHMEIRWKVTAPLVVVGLGIHDGEQVVLWRLRETVQSRLTDLSAETIGRTEQDFNQMVREVPLELPEGITVVGLTVRLRLDEREASGSTWWRARRARRARQKPEPPSDSDPEDTGSWALPSPPATEQPPTQQPQRRPPTPPPGPGQQPPLDLGPPPKPERYLAADFPARAALGAVADLIVRITPDSTGGTHQARARLKPITAAAVTVIAHATPGLRPLGRLQQELAVPDAGGSEPVRFAFEVQQAGLQTVQLTAWAGGTFLGELAVELSAEQSVPPASALRRVAELGEPRATPGEVTLQVRQSPGGQYMFQLLSARTIYDPITESLARDPAGAVERTIAALQELAVKGGPYQGAAAEVWLREAGVNLWQQMVPQVIKEQFWELHGEITAFNIASDQDVVPWELLYPLAPGRDAGFLVQQFPVLRQTYGRRRAAAIALDRAAFVIPEGSPPDAYAEITEINRRLRRTRTRADGQLMTGLQELLQWISAGPSGLLHFACHNYFDAGAGSSISLRGGGFAPLMLTSAAATRALAGHAPLVFLNACRSAGPVYEYTQLVSWATQFMAAGAGAFVGTLWAVPSETAGRFAEAFYEACLDRRLPLGQALMAARTAVRDPADPTWLAYTGYGDHAAVIGGIG